MRAEGAGDREIWYTCLYNQLVQFLNFPEFFIIQLREQMFISDSSSTEEMSGCLLCFFQQI